MSASTHDHARRLGSALLVAVVAGGVVEVILDNAESGATEPTITIARQATVRATPPMTLPAPTTTTTPPVATKPEQVAASWYAARHHLPVRQIKVLQADRLSARKVQVLLMVQKAKGRLDSAIVTVTRTTSGWQVAG